MNKIFNYVAASCCIVFFLTSCGVATDPSETYRNETSQQIFDKAEKELRQKSYTEAVKRYEALDVQYPYGANAEIASLHLIYAYYMKEDFALAVAAADRFIRVYPTAAHVDYAYYLRGLADYYQSLGVLERVFSVNIATRDLTQIKKSFDDFSVLVQRFPSSRYAPAAHQYMVYLRNIIANHDLNIAQYYYDRRAYMAAANRASNVVAHYQGTPAVPDALVLMVKCYRELHLTKYEQDALTVLHFNYPNIAV